MNRFHACLNNLLKQANTKTSKRKIQRQTVIPHSRNHEESGTREALWDNLGRGVGVKRNFCPCKMTVTVS